MKKILYCIFAVAGLAAVAIVTQSCSSDKSYENDSGGDGGSESGTGGSMARFTIVGDYIYTVDERNLKITWIGNPEKPAAINTITLDRFGGNTIETIFPYDGKLFIGSSEAMYIYDLTNPRNPKLLSHTSHFRSCDPVVAYGNRAYVTLNNASINCGGRGDYLLIYDISGIMDGGSYYYTPQLLPGGTLEYRGSIHPAGLGVDGPAGKLFVCTNLGVEVYDINEDDFHMPVTYVCDLVDLRGVGLIDAYDVIPMDGLLIVIGQDGLYQFDYTGDTIELLSSYPVNRQ